MKKRYKINWRSEDEKKLEKAINDFNKRVKKLKAKSKDKGFIPAEISYKGTKKLITTRDEFNRVLKSLGRFKGKKAFKKVTFKNGEELTAWEKREIEIQKNVAIRRINKKLKELKRPEYKMRFGRI